MKTTFSGETFLNFVQDNCYYRYAKIDAIYRQMFGCKRIKIIIVFQYRIHSDHI